MGAPAASAGRSSDVSLLLRYGTKGARAQPGGGRCANLLITCAGYKKLRVYSYSYFFLWVLLYQQRQGCTQHPRTPA
eukprot:8318347-Pyramimonas_sp.AAC.1